jgi:hypothetical protein
MVVVWVMVVMVMVVRMVVMLFVEVLVFLVALVLLLVLALSLLVLLLVASTFFLEDFACCWQEQFPKEQFWHLLIGVFVALCVEDLWSES